MGQYTYLAKNINILERLVRRRIENKAYRFAAKWKEFLKQQMNAPKTGKRYTAKLRGVSYTWQASAPGEYPAVVSGNLLGSMHVSVHSTAKQIRVQLRFGAWYAQILELDPPKGLYRDPENSVPTSTGPWKGRRPLIAASRDFFREEFRRMVRFL